MLARIAVGIGTQQPPTGDYNSCVNNVLAAYIFRDLLEASSRPLSFGAQYAIGGCVPSSISTYLATAKNAAI